MTETRVIRPARGWEAPDLGQVWKHRELVLFLARRDIQLRYRQTLLGVGWAVLQPLLTTAVFALFFGRLGGIPSDGAPYALFALAALVPWQLFSFALLESSNSLVASQSILGKVWFPRIVIPLASIGAGIVDFLVSFVILLAALALFHAGFTWRIVAIPLFALLALVAALGVGLWLATLNVRYRDIRYTVPFLAQLWLFATPVVYPASLVPERFRSWLGLNPMASVVEGFRWALLGTPRPPGAMLAVSASVAAAALITGVLYFRRMETEFADVI